MNRKPILGLTFSVLIIMICFLTFTTLPFAETAEVIYGNEAEGMAPAPGVDTLKPRIAPAKPVHTPVGPGVHPNLVVVKFVEGSKVRLRNNELVNLASGDLSPALSLLSQFPGVTVERLFTRPETALEEERVRGFDATATATANGVIVVEAAGNGRDGPRPCAAWRCF